MEKIIDIIPPSEVADHHAWLLDRDERKDHEGYLRGLKEGEWAFRRKLRGLVGLPDERSEPR